MSNKFAIGIDLGTTYSCVAVFRNNKVEIIANEQGNRTTPSYVSFYKGDRLIGNPAKTKCNVNPTNTIFDAKRLIGRKVNEQSVKEDVKHFPFKVYGDNKGNPLIEVKNKNKETKEIETLKFVPEEVSAMVLSKMKEIAENYLGSEVTDAVVTVPAYFNDSQRQATKDACKIAGLNPLRIINEPTAAALAYGLDKKGERNILVFDFGGGTFDVTLLELADQIYQVKATAGNTHLGGEDLDNILVENTLIEFMKEAQKEGMTKEEAINLMKDEKAKRKLRTSCEKAKRDLSSMNETEIEIESFYEGYDLELTISRAKFEDLCKKEMEKCLDKVTSVLDDGNLDKSEIDDIVLVGGSTRIPYVQEMLQKYFNKEKLCKDINPDEAVAYGASVQASILSGADEEATREMILVDVSPLSLGIETAGGVFTKIIPRNSSIPCQKEQVFSTYNDNQSGVSVQVYEGERTMTKNNHLLGKFDLVGIPPKPRGVPKITVTFQMDADGILQVSAVEESSGKTVKVQIQNDKGRLSDEEIQDRIKEAEKYAEADLKLKEKIEAKQILENYMFGLRNQLSNDDLMEKLGEEKERELKECIDEMLDWFDKHSNELSKEPYVKFLKEMKEKIDPLLKLDKPKEQND